MDIFSLDNVSVGYGNKPVIADLNLRLPEGGITCLIGPNGCGKSTLLKSLCGLLPHSGKLEFYDRALDSWNRRERARYLSMLPQSPVAPEGLTVGQLVARGRHPYQTWYQRWSAGDDAVYTDAVTTTGLTELTDRPLHQLSGGQRQRAWIAMTIAQDTPVMLLDEPTTYLDLATSVDVLRLIRQLVDARGSTAIMVLHDLNLAARWSDRLILLGSDGKLAAQGTPAEVLTEDLLAEVFGLDAVIATDPVSGGPLVVPK